MGSTPPYFSVYPLPAKVPTNAAVLVSQYMSWTVTVLDGKTSIDVVVEPFGSSSGMGATLAIRPVHGWPPGRSLEVVAVMTGAEKRHPFETARSPHETPPTCAWTGPVTIHPKSPTPEPDTWPTNIPRPPANLRTFPLPQIESPAGYMVAARLWLTDRGKRQPHDVCLSSGSPHVSLAPGYGQDAFSDEAQIIGIELTDVAGNVARYGTTSWT